MIKAEGIHKTFEDFTALDNITCSISDGCIYGMVGSNGAGKSTTMSLLMGLIFPLNKVISLGLLDKVVLVNQHF